MAGARPRDKCLLNVSSELCGRGKCEETAVERGFLGQMAVGDQPSNEVDQEIGRAAMAGMFDLADILELVVDGLNDGPLAQEQLVRDLHEPIAHVLAQPGDQVHALLVDQLLG